MIGLRYLCLLVLSLTALVVPATAQAVVYGSEVDSDFANLQRGIWTPEQVRDSLAKLHAAGASVARAGADWANAERKRPVHGRHRYDWSYDDLVAGELAIAHVRWDPLLAYTPKWAQQHIRPLYYRAKGGGGFFAPVPPASNSNYAAYVSAFARRYGVGGSFWRAHHQLPNEAVTTFEIWNEPDDRWTWGRNVNLQDYAQLYLAAYRAIKRVDRHSQVITGGLAFNRTSLPRLLKAFAGLPMDGLGVHPYGSDADATIAVVRWTEAEMVAFGRGRTPLVVNEYGWTSSRKQQFQTVPRRALAGDVRRAIVGLSKIKRVTTVMPFGWADPSWGLNGGGLADAIRRAAGR